MAGLVIGDPITLHTALRSANVIPGDTLLLRAGTYSANYVVPFSGTAQNYITIKPYQNERVIINGQVTVTGNYVRLQGLEITNNTVRNRSASAGTVGVDALGNYNEIVNCIIHDHDQGITTSKTKTGHVYYGNLVYFCGWDSTDGHGTYPQNNIGNAKTFKRNVFCDNFGWGIHAYGSGSFISDFIFDGNICFDNGEPRAENTADIFNGGSGGLQNPIVRNNLTYRSTHRAGMGGGCQIGYGSNTATGIQVYDNYFANTQWALIFAGTVTISRFNGNTLYGALVGADVGDNTLAASYPVSGNHIVLQSNEYDANRAQLAIYNWALANTVNVDVSSVFGASGTVEAHNAQDYYTDIQTLTITAGVITVNMQAANRSVATPVGWTAPAKTYPQFGCFVLIKQ